MLQELKVQIDIQAVRIFKTQIQIQSPLCRMQNPNYGVIFHHLNLHLTLETLTHGIRNPSSSKI